MLPYKNVYSLQDGRLVKNKENKIEYYDENGKKRVKTNPTYKDFAHVGMYPLKEGGESNPCLNKDCASYEVENDSFVIKCEFSQGEEAFCALENGCILASKEEFQIK